MELPVDSQIQELIAIGFDKWTLLTAGGIFILLRALQKTALAKWNWYRRSLPIIPECLGIASAIFGGLPVLEGQSVVLKIAAGLWCGYLSQRFHKVLGQTILGDDKSITSKED